MKRVRQPVCSSLAPAKDVSEGECFFLIAESHHPWHRDLVFMRLRGAPVGLDGTASAGVRLHIKSVALETGEENFVPADEIVSRVEVTFTVGLGGATT